MRPSICAVDSTTLSARRRISRATTPNRLPDSPALAAAVAEFAAQGDEPALGILRAAGEDLARMALALNERLQLPAPQVAVSGSILVNVPAVRQSFLQELRRGSPQAKLLEEEVEPTKGALHLYRTEKGVFD